jgi:hypothetical protein
MQHLTTYQQPTRNDLEDARERLLVIVTAYRWNSGEPPRLWTASVEALRAIEDAIGLEHTYPARPARRNTRRCKDNYEGGADE